MNTAQSGASFNLTITNTVVLKPEERPLVRISPVAYCKMMALVDSTTTEIAWHGICHRTGPREYLISDILMYPQKAAGVTVESDDARYPQWMMGLTEEQHNNLRFQGHSHVRMATSPSGIDEKNWAEYLQDFSGEDFYVFVIANKLHSRYFRIFDYKENAVFDNHEIDFEIDLTDTMSVEAWAEEENKQHLVTRSVYAAPSVATAGTSYKSKVNTATSPITNGNMGLNYVANQTSEASEEEMASREYKMLQAALADPFYYDDGYTRSGYPYAYGCADDYEYSDPGISTARGEKKNKKSKKQKEVY